MTIRWSCSDGGENWASYNGYVGDRLRFHVIGERFGGKVDSWDLRDFVNKKSYVDLARLKDAKARAQSILDQEDSS